MYHLTHCLLKNLSISCWSQLCYKWLRVVQTIDSYIFGHHQQIRLSKWNLTPTNLTNKHLYIKVLFSGVEAIKFEEEFYKSDPIWLPHGKYLSTWLLCLSSWNKMAGQQSIFGHFSEWGSLDQVVSASYGSQMILFICQTSLSLLSWF